MSTIRVGENRPCAKAHNYPRPNLPPLPLPLPLRLRRLPPLAPIEPETRTVSDLQTLIDAGKKFGTICTAPPGLPRIKHYPEHKRLGDVGGWVPGEFNLGPPACGPWWGCGEPESS